MCIPEDLDLPNMNIDLKINDGDKLEKPDNIYNIVKDKPDPQDNSNQKPLTTKAPVPEVFVPKPSENNLVINPSSQFDACQQKFHHASLMAHNKYRAMHYAPALKSNTGLQSTALNYANYLASREVFKHSGARGLGENLAYLWSSKIKNLGDCSSKKIQQTLLKISIKILKFF